MGGKGPIKPSKRSDEEDYGASSEKSSSGKRDDMDQFAFLKQVVADSLVTDAGQGSDDLTEHALRLLQDPVMGVITLLGVGVFAPYGCLPGLRLTSPAGKHMELDVKQWIKTWGISDMKWNRSQWTRLLHLLDLSKLAAPLRICITAAAVPKNQAYRIFEVCVAHRAELAAWSEVEVPEQGDDEAEAHMALAVGQWLTSCTSTFKEVVELLKADFETTDSSEIMRNWVMLEVVDCGKWSAYRSKEALYYTQLEQFYDEKLAWPIRRDRLIAALGQYSIFRDNIAMRSTVFPNLRKATTLVNFDNVLRKLEDDNYPICLDDVLGKAERAKRKEETGGSRQQDGKKTVICKNYAYKGTCSYGARCNFSHAGERKNPRESASEPGTRKTNEATSIKKEEKGTIVNDPDNKAKECQFNKVGKCKFGDKCIFKHNPQDSEVRRSERLNKGVYIAQSVISGKSVDPDLVCEDVRRFDGLVNDNVEAHLICDTGSQLNLVTRGFVDKANLHKEAIAAIDFSGISGGCCSFNEITSFVVKVGDCQTKVKAGVVSSLPKGADVLLNNKVTESFAVCSACVAEDHIDNIIRKELNFDWVPLRSAPGFAMRCRELRTDEAKDHENQRFCFEISIDPGGLPEGKWPRQFSDFGKKIYDRLAEDEKYAYDMALEEFVTLGHWIPVTQAEAMGDDCAPVVVCFPVKQQTEAADVSKKTSFKVRPVIQAKPVNATLTGSGQHAAGYGGASTGDILSGLRLSFDNAKDPKSNCLLSVDISKAFYRFRLGVMETPDAAKDSLQLPYIYILANGQFFRCSRVSFGLLHGPASLEAGVRELLRVARAVDPSLCEIATFVFYDDLQVCTDTDNVARFLDVISSVGQRLGLVIPPNKVDILSDSVQSVNNIPCTAQWCLKLGVKIRVCKGVLQLRCVTKQPDFLVSFRYAKDITTKSNMFKFTGVVNALNILRCHPLLGLGASLLSQIVGRAPPQNQWHAPLSLSGEQVSDVECLISTIQDEFAGIANCSHDSMSQRYTSLCVVSDASLSGFAYEISVGEECVLRSFAGGWNDRVHSGSWHVNRREVFALYSAVVGVDSMLQQDAYRHIKAITFNVDNSATVAWVSQGCPGAKSIERPAIRRLVCTIRDLIDSWRDEYGVATAIVHLSGELNTRADSLSRLVNKLQLKTIAAGGPSIDDDNSLCLFAGIDIGSVVLEDEFFERLRVQYDAAGDSDDTKWNGYYLRELIKDGVPDTLAKRFQIKNAREGWSYLSVYLPDLPEQGRIYIPPDKGESELRVQLLSLAHGVVAHNAPVQMRLQIGKYCWWPSIIVDCERYTRSCIGCQKERVRHTAANTKGYKESVVSNRFRVIYIDHAGPLDRWFFDDITTDAHIEKASVLVMLDAASGWVELVPVVNQSATVTARAILDRWVSRFGIMDELRSDMGVQRAINTSIKNPSIKRQVPISAEILLYGEETKGPLDSLVSASSNVVPLPIDENELSECVKKFGEAWAMEIGQVRAQRVDRLNDNECPDLTEGDSVFRVFQDGLGRSKSSGPYLIETINDNRVKLHGISTSVPIHQLRLCTNEDGKLGHTLNPPDPHNLIPMGRHNVPVKSVIMFITPEWDDDDDNEEIWSYDIGMVEANASPVMTIRRYYVDDKGGWRDWGENSSDRITIHYSQLVAVVQLTRKGRISEECRKKLKRAQIPC